MPYVQITLLQGKSPDYVSAIVDSVHQALVEEFKIPEQDKFQVVREVEPHQLIFPESYLGISHTDNILYIHITAKEGRTTDMKKRLYAKIAALVNERTDLPVDDIVIVLSENKVENWSFGRGSAQLIDKI